MIITVRDWFMSRNERERWLLVAMLALAVPLLLYLLVFSPMMSALDEAKDRHTAAVERNGRIKAELAQLQGSGDTTATPQFADLNVFVTESAGRSGLTLASAEPRGNGVAVTITGASPTAALRWLQEIEGQGAVVSDLRLTPAPDGTIGVTAQLGRRGQP